MPTPGLILKNKNKTKTGDGVARAKDGVFPGKRRVVMFEQTIVLVSGPKHRACFHCTVCRYAGWADQ